VTSGEHGGQETGPPRPSHLSGNVSPRTVRALLLQCGNAPSCWTVNGCSSFNYGTTWTEHVKVTAHVMVKKKLRSHPVVYYQISIIYYAPSVHNIIKQDAIITIRWYFATCFGRDRPSSGQLRTTILRYSKNSTQWDPISFTVNLDKIWKFLLNIKTVK